MDIRKFAEDVFSDHFGKAVPERREFVKFSKIEVGWFFIDDHVVYEKLSDADPSDPFGRGLARGPKLGPLGTGIFEFHADDEVETA